MSERKYKKKGYFYALFFAINTYDDSKIIDLDYPINDATALRKVLVDDYSFENKDEYFIEQADRDQIITSLEKVARELSEQDHLLIFFAGHGERKTDEKEGYWLPSDAISFSTAKWISAGTLITKLRAIKCKHILLIADCCKGGSIFEVYKSRSVTSESHPPNLSRSVQKSRSSSESNLPSTYSLDTE